MLNLFSLRHLQCHHGVRKFDISTSLHSTHCPCDKHRKRSQLTYVLSLFLFRHVYGRTFLERSLRICHRINTKSKIKWLFDYSPTLPTMLRRALKFLLFGLTSESALSTTSGLNLSFQVSSGGNENYFFRDNLTSAQVLLTSANSTSELRRLVVALPAGNSGSLSYFLPTNAAINGTLGVTLQNGSLTSTTDEFDNVGVQANLIFSENATLGVTIIGAVRAMRGMGPSY